MAEPVVGHFPDTPARHAAEGFGLLVFLASESLLFVVLLGLYAGGYAAYGSGFTAGAGHNLGWFGLTGTLVLLCSSGAVAMAVTSARREVLRSARIFLFLAMMLGVAFLCGKGWEYWDHYQHGILPGGAGHFYDEHPGVGLVYFVNLYWTTTALHAVHVLVGIGLLGLGILTCHRGDPGHRVELVGWYWHFVDLVWIVLWPLFYTVGGA